MREFPTKVTTAKSPERITKKFDFTSTENIDGVEVTVDVGNSRYVDVFIDLYGNISDVMLYTSVDGDTFLVLDNVQIFENDYFTIRVPHKYLKIRVNAPNIPVSIYISFTKY